MEREQNVSRKIGSQVHTQRQHGQNTNCNAKSRIDSLIQQASEFQNECLQTEQESPMLENLLSRIGTCQMKTVDEKQKLVSSIEKQQQEIRKFRELQEARNKNFFEVKTQNIELSQKLQSTYKSLEQLESSMVATRLACSELQEQCAPITITLKACLKHKDGLSDFKNELAQKVSELEDLLNNIKTRCCDMKQYWSQKVFQEKKAREDIKVESEKSIAQIKKATEETRVKRIALQQKCDALEERIREKQAEQEAFRNNMKQEQQKAMDIMLREKKKNQELSALAENHKQNVITLETRLREVTENTEFWKNKLSELQQKITDANEMKKILRKELENMNTKSCDLETKELEFEKALQKNSAIIMEISSELEHKSKEYAKMKEDFNEIQGSYSKKQEDIASLQALIQEKQMQQDAHVLKYRSKIEKLKESIKEKKDELLTIESGLEQDKEATSQLANKLQQNYSAISSMKQQLETSNQEVAEYKKNSASLEVEAKKWSKNKEESENKLTETEQKLQGLKESLASQNQKDEEFRSQTTREKRELEQELMNAQRELQGSVTHSEWIIQQTVTCVEQCKQNYAQYVKEKEAVLTTVKNEQQSLTKQLQDATSEKDHAEAKLKDKINVLEDRVKILELQLMNKKKLVSGVPPISSAPPKDGDGDLQILQSILKSPRIDKRLRRHIQFIDLRNDSEASLMSDATIRRKSLNDRSTFQKKKSIELPSNKFFKNKGQPPLTEKDISVEDFENFGED